MVGHWHLKRIWPDIDQWAVVVGAFRILPPASKETVRMQCIKLWAHESLDLVEKVTHCPGDDCCTPSAQTALVVARRESRPVWSLWRGQCAALVRRTRKGPGTVFGTEIWERKSIELESRHGTKLTRRHLKRRATHDSSAGFVTFL